MSNPANMGVVTGHLAADPVVFPNNDGSCTVKVTVYADNNYVNKTTNQVDSEKVPLEKYIPSGRGLGAYEHMKQGDQVSFSYSLRSNEYTDADGNRVYKGLVARIDSQKLLTSKAQSEARRAQRQGNAGQGNAGQNTQNAQAQNTQNTQGYQQQAQPQNQQPSGQQQNQQQGAVPPSNAYQGNQNQGYQQQAQAQQQPQQNQPQGYGFGNTTQSQSMANAPQYNQTYNPAQNYQNNQQQNQQSGQQSGQSDNLPF